MYVLLYIGLFMSLTTSIIEDLIATGDFFISPMRIYIALMSIYSILCFLVSGKTTFKPSYYRDRYLIFVAIFLALVTISILNSSDLAYSLKRAMHMYSLFILSYLVYWICMRSRINIKRLMIFWIIVGLMIGSIGIIQLIFSFQIGPYIPEERMLFGMPLVRINSLFLDPNFFAYSLFPVVFAILYYPFSYGHSQRLPLLLLALTTIFLTGSRGALLALLSTFMIMGLSRFWHLRIIKLFATASFAGVLVMGYYVTTHLETLLPVIIESDDQMGATSRGIIWMAGMNLIMESPYLGVGPGNFVTSGKADSLDFLPDYKRDKMNEMAGHSNYLEIAAESGIFALGAYVLIFVSLFRGLSTLHMQQISSKWLLWSLVSMAAANVVLSYYPYYLFVLMGTCLYQFEAGDRSYAQLHG